MTVQQENQLNKVSDILKEARELLNGVMYYSYTRLSDKEYARVHECFNFICKAADKL